MRELRRSVNGIPVSAFHRFLVPIAALLVGIAAAISVPATVWASTLTDTGFMKQGRISHTATLLDHTGTPLDGLVLIAGGNPEDTTTQLASAELYDPTHGSFSFTGSMNIARWGHSAVLLNAGPDPGNPLPDAGKVLIVGGWVQSYIYATDTAELFDPSTESFTLLPNRTSVARADFPTVVELGDGRVFVIGGTYEGFYGTATAKIDMYDRATRTFRKVADLPLSRRNNVSCLFDDMVLIGGGTFDCCDPVKNDLRLLTAELFNPDATPPVSIRTLHDMNFPHNSGAAVAIAEENECLVVGRGTPAERFSIANEKFTPVQLPFTPAQATLLHDQSNSPLVLASGSGITVYNPSTKSFATEPLNCGSQVNRQIADFDEGTTTLLDAGQTVLLAGGVSKRAAVYHLSDGQPQSYGFYQFDANDGDTVVLDAVDTSGTIGLLSMELDGPDGSPQGQTCGGRISQKLSGGTGGPYFVQVSDCIGHDPGNYSLTLNFVSDQQSNCAAPLPCGSPLPSDLVHPDGVPPGWVDSYKFPGAAGEQVTLSVAYTSGTIRPIELRLFDPEGQPVGGGDSCAGSVTVQLPAKNGAYTVLVNACAGLQTGSYAITWQPELCPTVTATPSPTVTPTPSPTPTPSMTASPTSTSTATGTSTATPTSTPTVIRTPSRRQTPTRTGTPTPTITKTRTATATVRPTLTRTATRTGTPTPTVTSTQTPIATARPTFTRTATRTPSFRSTPTSTGTATSTVSPTSTPTSGCAGDCNGDHRVTVDELVKGVNIALGSAGLGSCPQFDDNGDLRVTVDELVKGVNNALSGCGRRSSSAPSKASSSPQDRSDEPASVLLERIRVERAANTAQRRITDRAPRRRRTRSATEALAPES